MRNILIDALCATALLLSCTKSEIAESGSGVPSGPVKITVTAVNEVSKTSISDNAILWGKNEQMALMLLSGGRIANFSYSDKTSAFDGQAEAEFEFTLSGVTAGAYTYSGIYPASAVNPGNVDPTKISVTLPYLQKPVTGSYDPSAFIMVTKPEDFKSLQTNWKAYYRRAVALNKLTLKGLPAGIRSVCVKAPGKTLSGVRSIDCTVGKANALTEGADSVKMVWDTALAGGDVTVWFTSWGADITEGQTLAITANTLDASYVRTLTARAGGISFKENCLNELSVDMSKAEQKALGADFRKYEGTQCKPGSLNGIVIEGVFDPSTDLVKLSCFGGALESIGAEYKKLEPGRITFYNSVSRVNQNLQFYLIRNDKQYALTGNIRCVEPAPEEGYVKDSKFREALKAERKTYADGKEKGGLGAADCFDFCNMLLPDKAAAVKLQSGKISIGGWDFESISGFECFSGLGANAWDEPLIYFYNNNSLKEADFSNFNGYLAIGMSNCSSLKKIVLGPNMGGVNGAYNCPALETMDISKSSMVTQLMMQYGDGALKLVDLRYPSSSYKLSISGNLDLKALASVTNPTGLTIRLNSDLFTHRNAATNEGAWTKGIYAAWTKGATVELYEYGGNARKIGTVPAYSEDPNALSPDNSTEKDAQGNWISVNPWPYADKVINGTTILSSNNVAGLITDENGVAIEGVPVSDGYNYCFTDGNGVYQMATDSKARYVYYSLPAGYQTNLNGNNYPSFFSYIIGSDSWNRCDFTLRTKTVDETNWTLVGVGDPQPYSDAHVNRYKNETIADIVATLNSEQSGGNYNNAYAVALGDIVSNAPAYFDKIRNSMSNVQLSSGRYVPFYLLIGNHDHSTAGATNKMESEREYVEKIGPLDYSFNIGKAHVVCMDNYQPDESKYTSGYNGYYTCGISAAQLEWLKQDLNTVKDKENTLLIYCTHAPFMDGISNPQANHVVKSNNYAEMLGLFSEFHDCHLLSGHTHFWRCSQLKKYTCKSGRPVYEHNQNAPCGWIWSSNAVCADGSPLGYCLYDIRGNEIHDWVAKSNGYDKSFQMRVYDGNWKGYDKRGYGFSWWDADFSTVTSEKRYMYKQFEGSFIANIWGAEPDSWKVELFIDGQKYGDLIHNDGYSAGEYWNPFNADMLVESYLPSTPNGNCLFNQACQADHFWYIEAPGGDPSAVENWEIRATQTIPGSGVTHVYTCNRLQTDYTGFDAVPEIK